MKITKTQLEKIISEMLSCNETADFKLFESLETRNQFYDDLIKYAGGIGDNLYPPVFKTLSTGENQTNRAAGREYKKLFRKHADHEYLESTRKVHVSNSHDFDIKHPVLPKDELSCVIFSNDNRKNNFIRLGLSNRIKTGLDIVDGNETFPLVIEFETGRITYCEAKGLNSGYRKGFSTYKKRTEKPSLERDMSPEEIAKSIKHYEDKYGSDLGADLFYKWAKKKYDRINSDPNRWANQFSSGYNKLPTTPDMPNRSLGHPDYKYLTHDENPMKHLILDEEDLLFWESKTTGIYPNEAFIANWSIKTIHVPFIPDDDVRRAVVSKLNSMKRAVGGFTVSMLKEVE